jgi:hypothetical protein
MKLEGAERQVQASTMRRNKTDGAERGSVGAVLKSGSRRGNSGTLQHVSRGNSDRGAKRSERGMVKLLQAYYI